MLNLSSLVQAIQSAVEQATQSVSRENINGLLEYFHPLNDGKDSGKKVTGIADIEQMTPRMVNLQYPKLTPEGPVVHFVSVPLITLSPVPSLQISDVELEIDLELVESKGDIMVGFPQNKNDSRKGIFRRVKEDSSKANSKITIKIKADTKPMGVTAIVESYNKALRAQLPH